MKKILSIIAVLTVIFGMGMMTSCNSKPSADLVVYGKIYTAEGNQIVEAFAVKDGKYVYVGDKAGAEAFIEEGKTEVVDYTDKGLVMPGCGNAHAHYSLGYAIQSVGTVMGRDTDVDKFIKEIVPAAVKKAKDNGANVIFGSGWEMMKFPKDLCYRKMLDEVCSDIPIYFADEEGHKGLANTILLKKAGLIKEDGTAGKTEVRGGEIVLDADGVPTGYVKEQAGTYVRSFLDNEYLFSVDVAKANMAGIQEQLLSEGYTMYQDGYSSYFFNDNFYKAAQQMDQAGDMHFVLGTAWELDSWMDVDKTLEKASATKKYESAHIRTNWLKMFMDGTVESGTGFVEPLYPGGKQGIPNWSEEELTDITRKANEKGITMHVHVMGNKGVERIVNAYVNAGKKERSFGDKGTALFKKLKELVKKGNVARIQVKREEDTILNVPLNAGILGIAIAPLASVVAVVAAFGFKCSIEVIKTDGTIIDVSDAVTDTVSNVAERGSEAAEIVKGKAAELYEKGKGVADEYSDKIKDSDIYEKARDAADDLKDKAEDLADDLRDKADDLKDKAGDLADKAGDLADKAKDKAEGFKKQAEEFGKQKTAQFAQLLTSQAKQVGGINLIILDHALAADVNPTIVREAALLLQKSLENTALVAAFVSDGKPSLAVMYSPDLVAKGKNAGADIREGAKFIQGGGGGQPGLATAGGKNPDGIKDALEALVAIATK